MSHSIKRKSEARAGHPLPRPIDSTGRLVILDLSANIAHVWGRITKVALTEFEVEQNFNVEPGRYRSIVFDSAPSLKAADLKTCKLAEPWTLLDSKSTIPGSRPVGSSSTKAIPPYECRPEREWFNQTGLCKIGSKADSPLPVWPWTAPRESSHTIPP